VSAIPSYRGDSEVVAEAKSEVVALFEDAGFFVVDLGGLREGGQMQQLGAPLAGHNLIRLP
jgi:8-hydroxy-5-deazaflavin:NADPH oxidoreductase